MEAKLKQLILVGSALIALLGNATPAAAFRPLPLSAQDQKVLRDNFALCTAKLKGPYTENFCVCPDGEEDSGTRSERPARQRMQGSALLRRLPRAVGRGAGEAAHVHRQHLLTRPLPLGQLSGSQRPGARLHPREVLHRDQSEPQAESAQGLRRALRRRVRDACVGRLLRALPERSRVQRQRATFCWRTSCRSATSCVPTSARSKRCAPCRCASRTRIPSSSRCATRSTTKSLPAWCRSSWPFATRCRRDRLVRRSTS